MVDASALVEFLLRTDRGRRAAAVVTKPGVDLHVPSLCDIEVASALRGLVRGRRVTIGRAREALADYVDLPLMRHDHLGIVSRIFALRDNLSAYDAAYVALAEGLGARLLSGDERLVVATRAASDLDVERLD